MRVRFIVYAGVVLILALVLLAMVMAYTVFSAAAFTAVLETINSLRWQPTTGTVTVSQVLNHPQDEPLPGTYLVGYEYEVNGQRYAGSRVMFYGMFGRIDRVLWPFGFLTQAENIAARYPVGGQITVFYAPDEVSASTIERTLPGFLWALMGVNTLIGLRWIVQRLRGRGTPRPA